MTSRTSFAPERPFPLEAAQIDRFTRLGYLVLPAFLPGDLVERLKPEADRWVDEGLRDRSIQSCVDPGAQGPPPVMEIELAAHGELVGHPPLMDVLAQLMGPEFVFHHMHSHRQDPGIPGKSWHHDYEQNPQAERTHTMIHTLHYLDGIDAGTAPLAVLPGSQYEVAAKNARAAHGTAELPGEVVIDRLPPGSTVVLHSALFHARRPNPRQGDQPRYLVDSSYCQVGRRWPPVKPFWRHMLRRGRDLRLDRGRWPELFAERHFEEYVRPV
ncbi:phytanoyl-CoA dioxygenase family protein [Actinomadura litoris]|uniref:phytanoyl-CoA dioxygenase family protein n=1 Tax=Actinomadura litoris TaxID=2678616 RepID=UPI001FA6FF1B|nr:phytanoyl-CoA dioxygenase family protein [Actinomadura litoris]